MRVFAKKGFEAASLTALTKAMKINRVSMYATFGNKEELFRKALDLYSRGGAELFAGCLAADTARESWTGCFAKASRCSPTLPVGACAS